MAVENLSSALVTSLDATPRVATSTLQVGGILRSAFSTIETLGGDAGSTYRMIRLPSRSRMSYLALACDDLGTATAHVGVYQAVPAGGAAIDVDFFIASLDVGAAALVRTEITYGVAATVAIENRGKRLWEQLNFANDPKYDFDIVVVAASAALTGTVSLWAEYVLDE